MKKQLSRKRHHEIIFRLLTTPQVKFLVSFCSGLSHVLIATVVLGFFFPGITGEVSVVGFILGLTFCCFLFYTWFSFVKED